MLLTAAAVTNREENIHQILEVIEDLKSENEQCKMYFNDEFLHAYIDDDTQVLRIGTQNNMDMSNLEKYGTSILSKASNLVSSRDCYNLFEFCSPIKCDI